MSTPTIDIAIFEETITGISFESFNGHILDLVNVDISLSDFLTQFYGSSPVASTQFVLSSTTYDSYKFANKQINSLKLATAAVATTLGAKRSLNLATEILNFYSNDTHTNFFIKIKDRLKTYNYPTPNAQTINFLKRIINYGEIQTIFLQGVFVSFNCNQGNPPVKAGCESFLELQTQSQS